jgi:hypothetical protein
MHVLETERLLFRDHEDADVNYTGRHKLPRATRFL